jgi:putative endonuclease
VFAILRSRWAIAAKLQLHLVNLSLICVNRPRNPRSLSSTQHHLDVGHLAEALVEHWLVNQAWEILHRRWHCRWGELDLVAYAPAIALHPQTRSDRARSLQPSLIFVEVKARSRGNWDSDGRLAITPQKQAKLWQTAELFLSTFPQWAEHPCRFDVALVGCQPLSLSSSLKAVKSITQAAEQSIGDRQPNAPTTDLPQFPVIEVGKPVVVSGYQLILQDYIPGALEQS